MLRHRAIIRAASAGAGPCENSAWQSAVGPGNILPVADWRRRPHLPLLSPAWRIALSAPERPGNGADHHSTHTGFGLDSGPALRAVGRWRSAGLRVDWAVHSGILARPCELNAAEQQYDAPALHPAAFGGSSTFISGILPRVLIAITLISSATPALVVDAIPAADRQLVGPAGWLHP
jgi:hypothetical protein